MAGVREWRRVALEDLETEEERWSFSWPHAHERRRLCYELDHRGLLRPLACVDRGRGLVVVSGYRRLRWLRQRELPDAPVSVLHAEDTADLWDHLLAESRDHRPLNPVEAGLYVLRRTEMTGETHGELSREVFPSLGLAAKDGAADELLWLVRQPERYWEGFADGSRPLHVLRSLRNAGEEDARAVLEVTEGARGGVNKFAELVTWLLECGWREGIPVRRWLEREGLQRRWSGLDELRMAVKAKRYPTVVAWEEAFPRAVRAAGLPSGVRVQAPRGFEGRSYECRIQFTDLAELERRVDAVLERLRGGALSGLEEFLE